MRLRGLLGLAVVAFGVLSLTGCQGGQQGGEVKAEGAPPKGAAAAGLGAAASPAGAQPGAQQGQPGQPAPGGASPTAAPKPSTE